MAESQEKLFLARNITLLEGGNKFKGITVVPGDKDPDLAVHTSHTRTEGIPEIAPCDGIITVVDKSKPDDNPTGHTEQTSKLPDPTRILTEHEKEGSFQSIGSKRNQTINQLLEKKGVQTKQAFTQVKSAKAVTKYLQNSSKTGEQACWLAHSVCKPDQGSYSKDVNYSVIQLLGKGQYGSASLCKDKKKGKVFVMKQINIGNWNRNECIIPLQLQHKNLARIYGFKQSYIKMELYLEFSGASLNTFIQLNFPLAHEDVWSIIQQGLSALEYLHGHEIIHFDIKPDNMCVMRFQNVLLLKVIDFGSAKLPYQKLVVWGWTPEYMAPEMCRYVLQEKNNENFNVTAKSITMKVDVFALGLTVVYMISKRHAFLSVIGIKRYGELSKDETAKFRQQLLLEMAFKEENSLSKILKNIRCSPDLLALLGKMCCNVSKRNTSQEALNFLAERQAGFPPDGKCANEGLEEREDVGAKKRRLSNCTETPIRKSPDKVIFQQANNLPASEANGPKNNLKTQPPPINKETQKETNVKKRLRDKIIRKRKLHAEQTNGACVAANGMNSESSNRERETDLSASQILLIEEEYNGNFHHGNLPDLGNLI